MGGVHNVLAAACKSVKVDPQRYAARGKAFLDDERYDHLAEWIVTQALPKLSTSQRAEVEKLIALNQRALAGKKLSRAEERAFHCDEDAGGLSDAETIVTGLKMYAVKGARRAACAAARLLGEPFLDGLALELDRLDAITLVTKQKLPVEGPIVASLWRGLTGAKVTHQVVAFGKNRFGLIAKTKGRWTWLPGDRDDVLASVPDALMESAVAAVLGGAKISKEERGAVVAELPGRLAAIASSPDGRLFALSTTGLLAEWKTELRYGQPKVGKSRGLHAGPDGVVVSWGDGVFAWRDGEPTKVSPAKADGALVRDDGSIVWWEKGVLHFPKGKVVRGFPGQVVSRSGEHLVAASTKGVRVFKLVNGDLVTDLPLAAPQHSVSGDLRIATWRFDAKSQVVTVSSLRDGSELRVLTVDKGHIDRVVFADDQILVRYHAKKRVAVFDLAGKNRRLAARELGGPGASVEELHPLLRGTTLAFAPYPRGEVSVVAADGKALGTWRLSQRRVYQSGKSFLADAGGRVLFAYSHELDATRLLAF